MAMQVFAGMYVASYIAVHIHNYIAIVYIARYLLTHYAAIYQERSFMNHSAYAKDIAIANLGWIIILHYAYSYSYKF